MYSVSHLPKAINDIFDIEEYLNQHSPVAADRFTETFDERTANLVNYPFLWPVYEKDSFFRKMVIDDYVLFYSVDETRSLVVIHRIFHYSRNIDHEMRR